ncbi:hypothetical protein ACM66B_003924 [Microbotryomycetes sp. NB124-2]
MTGHADVIDTLSNGHGAAQQQAPVAVGPAGDSAPSSTTHPGSLASPSPPKPSTGHARAYAPVPGSPSQVSATSRGARSDLSNHQDRYNDRTPYAPYSPASASSVNYYRPGPPSPAGPSQVGPRGYAPYGHSAVPQPPPSAPQQQQQQPPSWTAYHHHHQSGYPSYPPPPPPAHLHHSVYSGSSPHFHLPPLPPPTSNAPLSQPSPSLPMHAPANGYGYGPPVVAAGPPPPPPPPPGAYDWSSQLPPIRLHPPPGSVATSSNGAGPDGRHGDGQDSYAGSVGAPPSWNYEQQGNNVNSVYYGNNHGAPPAESSGSSGRDRYAAPAIGAHDDQAQFQDGVQALSSMSRKNTGQAGPNGAGDDGQQQAGDMAEASSKGPQYIKPPPSDSEEEAPLEPGAKRKRKRRRRANEEPRDWALRKFTCEVCKKMFARPSALATHERSHSKEKPHVCPFPTCGRPFAVPSNLRRHQRVYNHYDPNQPLPPDAPGAGSSDLLQNGGSVATSVGQRSSGSSASSSATSTIGVQTMPLPPNPVASDPPQHHPFHPPPPPP